MAVNKTERKALLPWGFYIIKGHQVIEYIRKLNTAVEKNNEGNQGDQKMRVEVGKINVALWILRENVTARVTFGQRLEEGEEVSHAYMRKGILAIGNNKCKRGFKSKISWLCLKNNKEASVAGVEWMQARETWDRIKKLIGCSPPWVLLAILRITSKSVCLDLI